MSEKRVPKKRKGEPFNKDGIRPKKVQRVKEKIKKGVYIKQECPIMNRAIRNILNSGDLKGNDKEDN